MINKKKITEKRKNFTTSKKKFPRSNKIFNANFSSHKKSSYKNATENLRFSCTCNVLVSFCRSIKKRIFYTCLIWLFCANTFRLHHKVNCQIGGVHVMTQRKRTSSGIWWGFSKFWNVSIPSFRTTMNFPAKKFTRLRLEMIDRPKPPLKQLLVGTSSPYLGNIKKITLFH